MTSIQNLTRREIRHFVPYLPGKPIEEVQRELGLKKIVKLASNENAIGPSRQAVAALRQKAGLIFRYPEGPGTLLRLALAKKLKRHPAEIILGAGSDEIIELLGKTFLNPQDEIVVSEHAFIRYKMAADLMGAKTVSVKMQNFKHDALAMARAVTRRTKIIFIANPNNPTGTYLTKKEVAEFLAALKKQCAKVRPPAGAPFIVFDEAYFEFAQFLEKDYPDTLKIDAQGFNLITLRTFSKIYALAGLRVGYGIARAEIVTELDRVRPPFNVSSLAQAAAIAALEDRVHVQKSAKVVQQGLKFLRENLQRLGFKTIPSAGNFLLVEVSPHLGKSLFKTLLKKGVIARAMDEYELPYHLRVTVGMPAENKFFIEKFQEVVQP